jgi:hypothetical protein
VSIVSLLTFYRTGGIYTTANDMDKFVRSILNAELMSISKTNAWLKPRSFNPGLNSGWGGPWEILRTSKLSTDGRVIEIFHKSGGLPGYYSALILIPEFNVGLTLLYASDYQPILLFKEDFVRVAGEEIEKIIRADAKNKYTGFYKAISEVNSSIELVVDSGPGIRILAWVSNGTNFIDSYKFLKKSEGVRPDSDLRLIPTGLNRGLGEVWRLQPSSAKPAASEKIFDDFCMPHLDFFTYFDKPADEFVLKIVDGTVEMIQLTGFRISLYRAEAPKDRMILQTEL